MPKILGLNLLGVIVATIVFWMLGYLWYGVLFMQPWMEGHGLTPDNAGGFDIYMAGGIPTTFLQVLGVGLFLKWKGVADPVKAVSTAVLMWLLIALPLTMYAYLYLPAHNSTLLMIDASHVLAGWVVSAVVLSLIK